MRKEIIYFLKKSNNYISGEEISRSLEISRAGIWKYIQELRKEGYEIVAVPHLGYKLIASPDKLLPEEIQFNLRTKVLGRRIIYHQTVASTMEVAFKCGLEGVPEGTVVCAERQTKGRGRLGRSWASPKRKGIYASIILRPKLPPVEVAKLTLLCAVAVTEAIINTTGVKALIKWPNDVLVSQKKLAGILTEMNAEMDQVKFVVVGIGINVNAVLSDLVKGATSLKMETEKQFSRVDILQEILRQIEEWYGRFKAQGFRSVASRWRELSVTLKRRVRIIDPSGYIEGEALDIDYDGGLLIRQDSGVIVKRMAGDVVQLK